MSKREVSDLDMLMNQFLSNNSVIMRLLAKQEARDLTMSEMDALDSARALEKFLLSDMSKCANRS